MTTIAFDGRYLAADTLGVRGGNRSERPSCKIQASDGHAFATGGHWWAIRQYLIDWHAAGHPIADYPNPRGLDGCLVVVEGDTRQCKVFTHDAPYPDLEAAPIAFGTGGDIALGAMGAGLTAMEAVAIAARWDLKTGGPIDFVDLEFIDKGVQRWDGVMPSAKLPMPLNTPLEGDGALRSFPTPQELYRVAGNGMTARREVVDELRKVPLTRQNCVHGMKPDTCSTCRANRTANLYPV